MCTMSSCASTQGKALEFHLVLRFVAGSKPLTTRFTEYLSCKEGSFVSNDLCFAETILHLIAFCAHWPLALSDLFQEQSSAQSTNLYIATISNSCLASGALACWLRSEKMPNSLDLTNTMKQDATLKRFYLIEKVEDLRGDLSKFCDDWQLNRHWRQCLLCWVGTKGVQFWIPKILPQRNCRDKYKKSARCSIKCLRVD